MNIAIYLLCLALLLPAVFFAAFGLLIEGLTTWGLWEMIKILFSPLYDPFGKGIWVFLLFLASGGLLFAGFSDVARPYGFGSIAAIGVLSTLLIFRIYPGPWQWDNIFFLIPGAAAAFGSLYCLARPLR